MSYVFFCCPPLFICLYSVPMLAHHFMLSRVRTKCKWDEKARRWHCQLFRDHPYKAFNSLCQRRAWQELTLLWFSLLYLSREEEFDEYFEDMFLWLQPYCDNTSFCVPLTLSMFCLSVLEVFFWLVCFSTATEINLMFILYCQSWIYLCVTTLFQSHQYHGKKTTTHNSKWCQPR